MTQQPNPYQPPIVNINTQAVPSNQGYNPCPMPVSIGIRFLNYLIDYVAMFGLATLVAFVAAAFIGEGVLDIIDKIPNIVFGLAVSIVYYLVFEATTGRTIGKLFTRTKVVTTAGYPPGFGSILKRTLSRHIPLEPLTFLGNNGLHDSISKTVVVSTK